MQYMSFINVMLNDLSNISEWNIKIEIKLTVFVFYSIKLKINVVYTILFFRIFLIPF